MGALPDVVEDQFQRLFAAAGIGPVQVLPARRREDAPAVGPGTKVLLGGWRSQASTEWTAQVEERPHYSPR